jgi:hypothetical protein
MDAEDGAETAAGPANDDTVVVGNSAETRQSMLAWSGDEPDETVANLAQGDYDQDEDWWLLNHCSDVTGWRVERIDELTSAQMRECLAALVDDDEEDDEDDEEPDFSWEAAVVNAALILLAAAFVAGAIVGLS